MFPPPTATAHSRNRLLASLPPLDYHRLQPHLHPVTLPAKWLVYPYRGPMESVFFPTQGIVSAVVTMQNGTAIEVATIGNEGMTGLTAFMGGDSSPHEVRVLLNGAGLQLDAGILKRELETSASLRSLLNRYTTAFTLQTAYTVACTGLHQVEQRCCRWLLMAADALGSAVLPMTHDTLAAVLGVRRSSVTEVLLGLQGRGLVRKTRGNVEMTNRAGVEATACECYRAITNEFGRLFGFRELGA